VVDAASVTRLAIPEPAVSDGRLDTAVVYVDSFGNLRLAGTPDDVARALGPTAQGRRLRAEFQTQAGALVEEAPWSRTFGDIPVGSPLFYEDSFGNLAYADNQGNVASRLGVRVDDRVRIRPA
jgi:S-adenosyl-L-methionine hydrolase (adenosine-forming)